MNGRATVVGAGIGGLAAGIALRRAGLEVAVLERAERLEPLGAGLSIWPNGVRALRAIGVSDVTETAPRSGGALRRADGSVLGEFDPVAIEERFGDPLVGVHRADLHEALVRELGEENLRLGVEVVEGTDEGVRLADGAIEKADLVVGADGLGSVMRAGILGDGEPDDSGIVAYRGVVDWSSDIPAGEWWGGGCAAGLLPLAGGRVYWYLAFRGAPGGAADAVDRARGFADPVPDLVESTPAEAVLCHRLFDRPASSGWTRGRTTLLGDAAHPMLPFLGQGACCALEDAVALGEAVTGAPSVPGALDAYERTRARRAADLVKGSRLAAKVALATGPLAGVRNLATSVTPAKARLRQLDAVIGRV